MPLACHLTYQRTISKGHLGISKGHLGISKGHLGISKGHLGISKGVYIEHGGVPLACQLGLKNWHFAFGSGPAFLGIEACFGD